MDFSGTWLRGFVSGWSRVSAMRLRGAAEGLVRRRTRASGRDLDVLSACPGGERSRHRFPSTWSECASHIAVQKSRSRAASPRSSLGKVRRRSPGRHVPASLWSAQVLARPCLPPSPPFSLRSGLALRGVASRSAAAGPWVLPPARRPALVSTTRLSSAGDGMMVLETASSDALSI